MYLSNNGEKFLWKSPRGTAVIVLLIVLSTNFPHCTSHLASLFNSGGGLPVQHQKLLNNPIQPLIIPHHITRVSRDPSIRSDDGGVGDLGFTSRINLHQSRQKPNRFSSHFQNPSSQSGGGIGEIEGGTSSFSNEFSHQHNHYGPSSLSSLLSPGASSLGGGLTSTLFEGSGGGGGTVRDNFEDLAMMERNHHHIHHNEEEEDNPAFTPFISARALSNMGKFFEHLQENLLAMQQDSLEIGQPERRRMTSESSIALADEPAPPPLASAPDTSSQDYDGSPETQAAVTMALRWQPPASGVFRTAETSFPSSPPPAPSSLVSTLSASSSSTGGGGGGGNSRIGGGRGGRFQKMQTFFQPLSEDEVLLRRANNYNPSWLWTNMGLGKRKRR